MGRKRLQENASRRRKCYSWIVRNLEKLSLPFEGPSNKQNALSGLVGQYEGSDDEDDQDNGSTAILPPANGNKPPDVMDTKLADFLA
ncbi:hypothetical protein BSL78_29617, partial [Apostichopus japonicus]